MAKFRAASLAIWLALTGPVAIAEEPVTAVQEIVAVVNDDVILKTEFQERLDDFKQKVRGQGIALPPDELVKEKVMDQLVLEAIQLQKAKQAGITISDDDVENTLARLAASNQMSIEAFAKSYGPNDADYQNFRQRVHRELLINELRQKVLRRRIQISDHEVDFYLKNQAALGETVRYKLWHVLIPNDAQQSREDVESLIATLQSGRDFESTQLAHLLSLTPKILDWRTRAELPTFVEQDVPSLNIGDYAKPIESESGWHLVKLVDKEDAQREFEQQTQARHILIKPSAIQSETQVKLKLNKLISRLKAGESFESLAKSYSEDPGSRKVGGDLGWAGPGVFVPAFESIMESLKPGQVSEPFKTQYGWHIMEVVARKDVDVTEKRQRERAKEAIFKRKYNDELQNWLIEIRANAYVDIRQ